MKKETSSFSSFIEKLDAEILREDEAVLLVGGFYPMSVDGINPSNDKCKPIYNNECVVNKECKNTDCPNSNCGC